jgi:long-chain acyl-CoA synthetase
MNLANVVVGHDGEQVALIDGDEVVTFGDLRARAAALQLQLRELGVGPDDAVGLAAGNETHFAVATFAVLGLGGIVMPLNPSSRLPEMQEKIESGKPVALLVGDVGGDVLSYADDLSVPTLGLSELASGASTASADDGSFVVVDRDDDDRAFFMATSGVSGSPKVAVLSHRNLSWVQEALNTGPEALTDDDVVLGVLPFAHIFGLNVILLASLRIGARIVLQRRFDADESVDLVRNHGVTILAGAPPMWSRWAAIDAPDDSLASVRYGASGAAALPLGVFEAVRDRFGIEVAQGYGLTETSPVVTHGRGFPVRPSSVGKVMDGVTVALVDASGAPVDVGDEGEVVVRSPGVFQGYLDDVATTESVLTADGWLWTGDVGIFDDDGYLYLVDRIKDVVIVSGFNVYPAEVENVLMRHPDVTGAIVTGAACEETGEKVVAHVTGTSDRAGLEAFVASQLTRYKRPTEYHFLDELPIAATGKAIRRALR